MDEFNVFNIINLETTAVEGYVKNLCLDIIKLCEDWKKSKSDVIDVNHKVVALMALLNYDDNDKALSSICDYTALMNTFEVILRLFLIPNGLAFSVCGQFLTLCTSMNESCNKTLSQLFISFFMVFHTSEEISVYGKKLEYSNLNMLHLIELYISGGNKKTICSIFKGLVDVLCNTSKHFQIFADLAILFEKVLIHLTNQYILHKDLVNSSIDRIRVHLSCTVNPVIQDLLKITSFNSHDKGIFAQEIEIGIWILQCILRSAEVLQEQKLLDNVGSTLAFDQLISHYSTWSIIQTGIYHEKTSVRRRCAAVLKLVCDYIISRNVDFVVHWPNDLNTELAEDSYSSLNLQILNGNVGTSLIFCYASSRKHIFASKVKTLLLLCETLEENQLHVVKPILDKYLSIFAHPFNDDTVWKTSWLFSIFKRLFSHENRSIQKEGILMCLKLNFHHYPIMKERSSFSFLSVGLLNALRFDKVYSTSVLEEQRTSVVVSVVPQLLKDFVKNFYQQSDHNSTLFLKCLLDSIATGTWSPVSLLYVCNALYSLPVPSLEAWDSKNIAALRKILTTTVRTHHVYLRKVVQRILLGCLLKYCAVSEIQQGELLTIFAESHKGKALIRGTHLWENISVWCVENFFEMKKSHVHSTTNSVVQYLYLWLNELFSDNHKVIQTSELENAAVFFILCVDGLTTKKDMPKLIELVTMTTLHVKKITDRAATHLYLSQQRIDSVFTFLNAILTFCLESNPSPSRDKLPECMKKEMVSICEGVLDFICHKIPGSNQDFCSSQLHYQVAFNLLFLVDTNCPVNCKTKLFRKLNSTICFLLNTSSTIFHALRNLQEVQSTSNQLAAIDAVSFHWCCKAMTEYSVVLDEESMKILSDRLSSLDLQGILLRDSSHEKERKFKIAYVKYQWMCVPFALNKQLLSPVSFKLEVCMDQLVQQLDAMPRDCLECLYASAQALIIKVDSNFSDIFATCIRSLWKTFLDLIQSSFFRELYNSFVMAVFQRNVICASNHTAVGIAFTDILNEIVGLSKLKYGLLYDIIWIWSDLDTNRKKTIANNLDEFEKDTECLGNNEESCMFADIVKILLKKDNSASKVVTSTSPLLMSITEHVSFFIHCLLYCPNKTKGTESLDMAIKQAENMDVGVTVDAFNDKDTLVDTIASSILWKLKLSDSEHMAFGSFLLHKLLDETMLIITKKSHCHFGSVSHHLKQKIWQNLLVLLPFVSCEEAENVISKLIYQLGCDQQTSIRYIIEWGLALLLFRYQEYEQLLFTKLGTNLSKGDSSSLICSFMSVLLLCGLSRKYKTKSAQKDYFIKLANVVTPWCMAQNFTIRLYGLAVLRRIVEHFEKEGDLNALLEGNSTIIQCIAFADNSSGNVIKNWNKMKEHFMFFYLDPIADYSLETIFCTMPNLCHLKSVDLKQLNACITLEYTWIPIMNRRNILKNLQPSVWFSAADQSSSLKPAAEAIDHCLEDCGLDAHKQINLQRKFAVSNRKVVPGLVLVASLITKPSNLGGLTRTCEVFGVERLVLHSLAYVEDKLYQSLAVTAHKWVEMEEVKHWNLEEYFMKMRNLGYRLVGVEQTEQSKCLTGYKFPKKCVLILGNEKEGIPTSLLRSLDECIEIPQMGLIRSLNVHVSGAVTMWEYRKQHFI